MVPFLRFAKIIGNGSLIGNVQVLLTGGHLMSKLTEGEWMYELLEELFPICRSITGNGVRETLRIIQQLIPITIHEIATGTKVFDWEVPKEWNINEAYILDEEGNKIIDFKNNSLHVMNYSTPVDKWIDLKELQQHLYSIEELPDSIPYMTSYYKERWGFCISHNQRKELKDGKYRVLIDSELKNGHLTYGELLIAGNKEEEIFLSTYICHPSMANNELSGPVMATCLAKWIMKKPRKYTYRIIFVPETIGSITYLSRNLETMKKNIIAGINLTCVGDERTYSYLSSRYGNTLADRVAINILKHKHPEFKRYSYLDRGSDERQYCSPGIDLPVISIMRTKYGEYPEYHTSLDNLDLVTPTGLQGSYDVIKECIELLENNEKYINNCLGEPQLGKRGLYPSLGLKKTPEELMKLRNFLAYADGTNDLIEISNMIHVPVMDLYPIIAKLYEHQLISK